MIVCDGYIPKNPLARGSLGAKKGYVPGDKYLTKTTTPLLAAGLLIPSGRRDCPPKTDKVHDGVVVKNFLLFVLLLSFLLSCKSTAPAGESAPESGEASGQTAPLPETGDVPVPEEDGGEIDAELPDVPGEIVPAEDSSEEKIPGPENDTPDTFFPPRSPAEEKPALPEPESPHITTPQEPPPATTSPGLPLPELPQTQTSTESSAGLPQTFDPPPERDTPREEAPPVPVPPPPPARPPEPPPSRESAREQLPPQSPPAPGVEARPPEPPSFLKPAEPENPPPERQPVPGPAVPLPDLPARAPPESAGEEIVFSRTVRATVGQLIEIPFRGTGWVYLGELGNRRGIVYDSRRLDTGSGAGSADGQSFIFRAEVAGTFALKFYKQDFIEDYIINDYVQVIVGDDSENSAAEPYFIDRGRVIAEPRWPPSSGPAAGGRASSSETGVRETPPVPEPSSLPGPREASPQTAAPGEVPPPPETIPPAEAPPSRDLQNPPPNPGAPRPRPAVPDDGIVAVAPPQAVNPAFPPDTSPDEFVRRAKQEFEAGRIEPALVILDTMKQRYPSGTDEAWWLYGQLLEANSPSRDIRLALEYYRRLVRQYPQSPRAGEAQRRIAYLERYYFNIR